MNSHQILEELQFAKGLPVDALRAAGEQREEMLPLFLAEIERFVTADEAGEEVDPVLEDRLFFIFHLLGEWRERRAYRSLARLLRCSAERVDRLLGDSITVTSHRVMAAVFDGDPQPLYDVILDPDAEEFIRSRMCEAVAMVAVRDALAWDEAARFLRDCYIHIRPQRECAVWSGWQGAIALLGLGELESLVKKAFARHYIDPYDLTFDHFKKDLKHGMAHPGKATHGPEDEFELFGDTVDELSTWAGFADDADDIAETDLLVDLDEEDEQDLRRWLENGERVVDEPKVNPFKGVGRNDPCPCGSGKKFKRCCLTV